MESHLIWATVTKHTPWKECSCVQFPSELHLTAGSIDYQWSGWCSAAALIEPPSSRWMFDLSSGRNGKWSDLLCPPPPTPASSCQQLWPSLALWQKLVKDILIGWQCTSCLPSARCSLPRCERSGRHVGAWWSRGIDEARNDEEMRGGDGQATEMNVSHFVGGEETSKLRKRRRREVINKQGERICSSQVCAAQYSHYWNFTNYMCPKGINDHLN